MMNPNNILFSLLTHVAFTNVPMKKIEKCDIIQLFLSIHRLYTK